ncbi:MAG: hypothetical protein E6G94_14765 [Alphaproteobacteria bacterium]|nr:MAG: hypothetical protein E6G94_14765 [Alphaproteobacteria bacterium]
MPHFYFHIFNDQDTIDREGLELPDFAAARKTAVSEARILAGESIRRGHLNLGHRIDIEDDAGKITPVAFRDAFTIEG